MTSASNLPDKNLPAADPTNGADATAATPPFRLGPWWVEPDILSLRREDNVERIEPKMMELLLILAQQPGTVVPRQTLMTALWPDVTVGDDTLARLVSKLRRTLGDDARGPSYIETIPKRGYRLLPGVLGAVSNEGGALPPPPAETPARVRWAIVLTTVVFAVAVFAGIVMQPAGVDATLQRADDLYMRFTRSDNEAALALYERVLAERPQDPDALSGAANARVQRVVRWPDAPGEQNQGAGSITEALRAGLHKGRRAQAELTQARAAADRALEAAPHSGRALKARGLVAAAAGDLDTAADYYRRAIAAQPSEYAAEINLGEVLEIQGDLAAALTHYERAFKLMNAAYADEPQRIGRWHADLGVQIAKRHELMGRGAVARQWYERVLSLVPLYPPAAAGLAETLAAAGDLEAARALCRQLASRVTQREECRRLLAEP